MISSLPAIRTSTKDSVIVIEPDAKNVPADLLVSSLRSAQIQIDRMPLSGVGNCNLKGKVALVLLEYNSGILGDISGDDFAAVKKIIFGSKHTLWVTKGAVMETTTPDSSLIHGLSRSLRSENPAVKLTILDLDPFQGSDCHDNEWAINRVLETMQSDGFQAQEFEYAVRKGSLLVPRIHPIPERSRVLRVADAPRRVPFKDVGGSPFLTIQTPGRLETLCFVDTNETAKKLEQNQIEIKVMAVGINSRDHMVAMGQIEDQCLGTECSGIVTAVGSATSKYNVGDRVLTFRHGCFGAHVRVDEQMAHRMLDNMTFEEAASIPCAFTTAYHALFEIAKLKRRESVLIHAAAGATGQAAIMLSNIVGAQIFATASNSQEKRFLMESYHIAEERIFRNSDIVLSAAMKEATQGKGFDVVLSSLSGDPLRQSWLSIAPLGRFIDLSMDDMSMLLKSLPSPLSNSRIQCTIPTSR